MLSWDQVERTIARSRSATAARSSLANPAARLLREFERHHRLAVIGVPGDAPDVAARLLGYVIEPAYRRACTLMIAADLDEDAFLARATAPDPGWGHPWVAERLAHRLARYHDATWITVPPPCPRWRRWLAVLSPRGDGAPASGSRLDPQQAAAVRAGDGVVQVIAPAGSGKTTVLVARVGELLRRGTPAGEILCTTFNRDARVEIAARLARAGIVGVEVRSFHGLGHRILREEGRLRPTIGELDEAAWARLLARSPANTSGETDLDVAAAREVITDYKLAVMITPDEALAAAATDGQRWRARLYGAYERHLARIRRHDFDDLVAVAVGLLRSDRDVRRRWQDRFSRVLVDEYQDIEPAQARLVGLLAAPQDSLFCVGDEDQCIYAWRRAAVQRVIELDQVYPGLQRYPLIRNYRCGRRITTASRRLIRHNRQRFRKPLRAGARHRGRIVVHRVRDRREGGALAARLLHGSPPEAGVVLARTSSLLAEVAAEARATAADQPALATVHAAKGREWDHVVIHGADAGRFPHARAAVDDAGLEDERRLFYVALTRARERLDIICTRGRESRFVDEAGLRTW
ncbi:AAA family ATPase [bacterium]|nr:AAA family ATPase [bacterium]